MARHKKLTPGAAARVFRAGDLSQPVGGGLTVPDDGTWLAVRHLAPGDYVVLDSCGQEVAFTVGGADDELAVTFVDVKGADALPESCSDPNPAYNPETGEFDLVLDPGTGEWGPAPDDEPA